VSLRQTAWWLALLCSTVAAAPPALAEPYLAVQMGYKCNACHVNPTGGGLRTAFGNIFAENVLPQHTLPSGFPLWTGTPLKFLQLGADARWAESDTRVPDNPSQRQSGFEQVRAYANLMLIPDRLSYYVDEQLAPGNRVPMEYYGRFSDPRTGLYLKVGQLYLPFGWRLQDNTAFVREVSGISMTTPDKGVELGFERPEWSAQLDYTRGDANLATSTGHQITGQVVRILSRWRAGVATLFEQSNLGNREVQGVFAGLHTGQVAWLGELDLVRDASYRGGPRRLLGGLAEADWGFKKGQNLKVTAEYYDPNRAVSNDQQTRWSVLYEYTPYPFIQGRAGWRRFRGIPQSDLENRQLLFAELHLLF